MKDYIEFWEFKAPVYGSDFYRYTYVNKSKIESIIIRWDTGVNKFIVVILTKDRKYKPTGISIDPNLYMCSEINDQCYWTNYDSAKEYIENLMNS